MSEELVSVALPGTLPSAWFDTARAVHADDPRWIPEEPLAVQQEFSAHNPWFSSCRAQALLLPGKARLCMFFDPRAQLEGQVAAYFGDFVSTGDADAEARLFAAAEAWARAQGAAQLIGPLHMSTWQSYRVLVSMESDGLPFLGEPYDAPQALSALERAGFTPIQGYLSQVLDHAGMAGMAKRLVDAGQKAIGLGYRVEPEGIAAALALLPTFYEQSMVIFRDNFAFTPPPKELWMMGMRAHLRRACPHTTVIARDARGDVIGFCVNYPHWGAAVVQGAKQRIPLSQLDYTQHAHLLGDKPVLILKTMGVLLEHQSSRVGSLILGRCAELGLPHYPGGAFCATVRDDNRSRRFGEGFQVSERRYALFGRALA